MIQPESAKLPHLSLGTSSDRIGTPKGPKSYYLTAARSLDGGRFNPYASLNYSDFEDGFNIPFGLSMRIDKGLSATLMNDGRRSHALLTYSRENWSLSLMWVWFRHPGVSFSWGF